MDNNIIQGPQSNEAQLIGQLAIAAIHAQKPKLWFLGEKGGDDYGIDYEALVFASLQDGGQFYVQIQLKGTTQKKHISADKSYISHEFNKRTLALWNNSASVILVIIVDLTETDDPSTAPIYYEFVNETLDELLPTIPEKQKGVTLRVSTANRLNRALDIIPLVGPYLQSIKDSKAALKRLKNPVSSANRVKFATNIDADETLVFSMDADNSDIKGVIDQSPHAEIYRLHLNNLRSGNYEAVIKSVKSPTITEIESDPKDSGLRAYLLSKAYEETSDKEQAQVLMKLASRLIPNNDEILSGTFQHQLENIKLGKAGDADRQSLFEEMEQFEGPYIVSMKARLLAMAGKFEEARAILVGLSNEKVGITIPTISIIEKEWQRALVEVEEILSTETLQAKAKFWLMVLKSRAYFELALKDVPRLEDEQLIVPSSGLPEINLDNLKRAYETSLWAMKEAQRLNWPVNTEYLMDIFVISSMVLDKIDNNLPILSEFLYLKPYLTQTRELVSRLSIQFDNPRIALKLAELSKDFPKFENQDLLVIVATNAAGNIGEAFRLFNENIFTNSVKNEVYYSSLLILAMAADKSFQTKIFDRIKNELSNNDLGKFHLAILDCYIKVNHSQQKKMDALSELKDFWLEQNHPYQIALHILDNLYPLDPIEAKLVIEICEIYITKNCLPVEHSLIYAHSLLTLDQHQIAISFLESTIKRYPENNEIKSLLGIALEINGQSERAFTLIQELLQDGYASNNARQYFCNIAIRMGYFDIAESQMRAALASTSSPVVKISILQTLIRLLFSQKDRKDEIPDLAWEYGRLIDPNNETQEGLFLQFYLMATSNANSSEAIRTEEFQRRLLTYSTSFPDSGILWSAQLPEDGTPEELLSAINNALGITKESLEKGEALERNIDRGEIAIPFSWRPRRFLRNVPDIFTLWELNKNTIPERQGYHLTCYLNDDPVATPDIDINDEIVISLVSLIILNDIGLLNTFLKTFPKVVIARNILLKLQASRSMLATLAEYTIASEILVALQENFSKIIHPPMDATDEDVHFISWHPEEKQAMSVDNRVYMCDDIIESILVCQASNEKLTKKRITTLDFLHWANEKSGLLDDSQVADYIAKLCELNVGHVIVRRKYFLAAIPRSLQYASNEAEELNAFSEAKALNSMLDGVWAYGKPYDELEGHFANNAAYLISDGKANSAVITSLWTRWVQSIRFNTELEFSSLERVCLSFIRILAIMPRDETAIRQLWSAFWVTLKRNCESELSEPEDITGVKYLARMIGQVRGKDDNQTVNAGELFSKAAQGLESGTHLYDLFNSEFVEAAAKAATQRKESDAK